MNPETTGFRKGRVTVRMTDMKTIFEIDAFIKGDCAIHRTIIGVPDGQGNGFGGSWTVTHIPTGLSYHTFAYQVHARKFASRVPELGLPSLGDSKDPLVTKRWDKNKRRQVRSTVMDLALAVQA